MNRLALLALFAPVLLVGCGSTSSSSPAPITRAGGQLLWGPCSRQYDHTYTCARLEVPLDYANPSGRLITIALIRTKATGKKIGSLLVNPGGPGASAVADWDFLSGTVSKSVHKNFDVIGFDPRGVGDSTAIHCASAAELDAYTSLDFSPTTAAGEQALIDGARQLAAGCVARSGDLLPFIGTKSAARDMDAIRQATGDAKLSYLGFSYGTFLGAQYAQDFPTRVRAMVLDGALDPAEPPVQSADVQSNAFQHQLDRFLSHCSGNASCAWKFSGDAQVALRALTAKVDAAALPTKSGRRLSAGQLFFGIGVALYNPSNWPQLEKALNGVAQGDGTLMLALSDAYTERTADGEYSNSTEANLAINCRDDAWPRTPAAFFSAAAASAATAPDFGPANLNLALACAFFPVADSGTAASALTATGAPPIVVVATTGDPATPYSQGEALAKQLTSGVLVTNVGEQHTAYAYSACVRNLADAYLIDLTVPPAGTRCDDE